MKVLRFIIPGLLIATVAGFLCYQGFVQNNLDDRDLIRGLLIIAGAVMTMIRPQRQKIVNKKAVYQKTYGEFIQNAFNHDPRLEKLFYNAVHNYAQRKPSAAIGKLKKLRGECQQSNDLRAVTVFAALCLDDMQLYDVAITQYDAALKIRDSSTLHSNMGLCYQRMGNHSEAQACYERAIQSDPKNEYAYNNLSALYCRQQNYEKSLEYAKQAIAINANMKQALSTAAVCCYMLCYEEDYKKYYRQAVAAGYDGNKIKNFIAQLDPNI